MPSLQCGNHGILLCETFHDGVSRPVQALVDRPDMVRRQMNFKRLVLTDFKIDIPRLAKKKVLTAALEESGAPPCSLQHRLHIGGLLGTPISEQRN